MKDTLIVNIELLEILFIGDAFIIISIVVVVQQKPKLKDFLSNPNQMNIYINPKNLSLKNLMAILKSPKLNSRINKSFYRF